MMKSVTVNEMFENAWVAVQIENATDCLECAATGEGYIYTDACDLVEATLFGGASFPKEVDYTSCLAASYLDQVYARCM